MIKTIAPTSPMLKKYIDCFYIYEGKSNSVFNYVAFPHFNTGLSFFKGASVHRQNWNLQISENTNDFKTNLTEYFDINLSMFQSLNYNLDIIMEFIIKIEENQGIFLTC